MNGQLSVFVYTVDYGTKSYHLGHRWYQYNLIKTLNETWISNCKTI